MIDKLADKAHVGDLWKALRLPQQRRYHRHLAKRVGLGKILHRVGIEHRLAQVEDRLFIGHWEGDTVLKSHKASGLVMLVESRSGYLQAAWLPCITVQGAARALTAPRPEEGVAKGAKP
uniref:hypothetical protein n=1 Tax=Aidingimonas lacisalsi TaxID=2604086 RepID=UPI0011D1D0BA|nr:hypothetical protein [Aidingimonas lacisalsi]